MAFFFSVQLRGRVLLLLIPIAGVFGGCQTPDLKPFAQASAAVATGIALGGDLALQPIAREPAFVGNEFVGPDAPNHPVHALAAEWQRRRRAAEAILAYSSSLAAIGDAATHRMANATQLLQSVQQLAAAVPGVSLGSNAAGNLMITALSDAVEVKAWRDMAAAVRNADAAVAVIAAVIQQDLKAMGDLHAGYHKTQIAIAKTAQEFRELSRLQDALRAEQQAKRTALAGLPGDAGIGAELSRISTLIGSVERDLQPQLAAVARHRTALLNGADFYAAAAAAVGAWAAAHHDLVRAFEDRRAPNVAVLLVRAEEIQLQLQELKSARRQPLTP